MYWPVKLFMDERPEQASKELVNTGRAQVGFSVTFSRQKV